MTPREVKEAAWSIVKSRELRKEHPRAYAWARAYLGLEDRERVVGSRRTHGEGVDWPDVD